MSFNTNMNITIGQQLRITELDRNNSYSILIEWIFTDRSMAHIYYSINAIIISEKTCPKPTCHLKIFYSKLRETYFIRKEIANGERDDRIIHIEIV
jgi:hypothetical protein